MKSITCEVGLFKLRLVEEKLHSMEYICVFGHSGASFSYHIGRGFFSKLVTIVGTDDLIDQFIEWYREEVL
jgi:hypothetical protein